MAGPCDCGNVPSGFIKYGANRGPVSFSGSTLLNGVSYAVG